MIPRDQCHHQVEPGYTAAPNDEASVREADDEEALSVGRDEGIHRLVSFGERRADGWRPLSIDEA